MILKMYSYKDEQTGYRTPIIAGNDNDMKRTFTIEAKNPNSMLNMCPQDYSVWAIGEWDTDTGIFINYEEKRLIERAVNVVEQNTQRRD